jgi:hypothetical protein
VDDVEYRFKQLQRSGQTMVLPPGMDYQVVPVIRANRARVGLCPEPGCRMEASHCPHAQTPALPGAVITTKRVKSQPVQNQYANCTHPAAVVEEIRTAGSASPIRRIVTECPKCARPHV